MSVENPVVKRVAQVTGVGILTNAGLAYVASTTVTAGIAPSELYEVATVLPTIEHANNMLSSLGAAGVTEFIARMREMSPAQQNAIRLSGMLLVALLQYVGETDMLPLSGVHDMWDTIWGVGVIPACTLTAHYYFNKLEERLK